MHLLLQQSKRIEMDFLEVRTMWKISVPHRPTTLRLLLYSSSINNYHIIDKELSTNKIATMQPAGVQDNMVFIVDLSKLSKLEDLRADDLGCWTCNGKRCMWCEVDDGLVLEIYTKRKPTDPINDSSKIYTFVKRYYKHATSNDFKRVVVEIYGMCFIVIAAC